MATNGERKADGGIVETIKTVFWALLIAGIFRTLFFQPFWIPSGSMKDTLLIGDFLFVNKMAYGYSRYSCPFAMCPISGRSFGSEPERGDVVVFRHPVNGSDFIKRLIGLPGDRMQMQDGVIFLNGEEVPQEPAGVFEEVYEPQGPMGQFPRCENGPVGEGGICTESPLHRDAAGRPPAHDVLNIVDQRASADNTDVFTVPEGPLLLHGRQPRQQPGQPLCARPWAAWASCRPKPDRPGRPDHVLVRRPVDAVLLDLAVRPLLQGGRVRLSADLGFSRPARPQFAPRAAVRA
jgi:signal peptidase I